MKDKPISVSLRADRTYTLGLKALAQAKKTSVADLTRKALDECLGGELAPFLSFFANGVNADLQSNNQIDTTSGPGAA